MTDKNRARRLGHLELWSASPTLCDNYTGCGLGIVSEPDHRMTVDI
jgi:hypothetical protein